jgi:hypothetical protein
MKIEFPHPLGREEARARLEALGSYLTRRHGIAVTWTGDRATFSGKYMMVKIAGEMTCEDGVVRFVGEDPGFMLRGQATKYIRGKLEVYLDPATPLANLPRG